MAIEHQSDQPGGGDRVAGPVTLSVAAVVAAMAIVDLSIITAWVDGRIGSVDAVLAHLLAGSILCLIAGMLQTSQASGLLVTALLLVLLGPLGAFAMLVAGLQAEQRGPSPSVARAVLRNPVGSRRPWTLADRIHSDILQQRRPPDVSGPVDSYEGVFRGADTARQQRALAAISRSYRPEMLHALQVALGSPVPSVRVQAAAVYAKLRGNFNERAKVLLAEHADAGSVDACGDRIEECFVVARSGFVDAQVASSLRDIATRLGARQGVKPDAGVGRAHDPADAAPIAEMDATHPRLKRYSCGGVA